MNLSITSSLSTSPALMAALVLVPFASGCADLLHDLQRGPSCTSNFESRDKIETTHGSIELVEVTGNCADAGTWRLHGPGELRVYDLPDRPEDLQVTVKKPYWLRLSATVGDDRRSWDYVAAENHDGELVGKRCEAPVLDDEAPSLQACLGNTNGPEWANLARKLDRPTAFDREASALVMNASQAPSDAVSGLHYFRRTWVDGDDEALRSEENIATVRAMISKVGCGPMVRATPQSWSQYLAVVDIIMAGDTDQLLATCDSWLVEKWPEQHEKLQSRLEVPSVVHSVDAALVAQSGPIDGNTLDLWLARLEYPPKPSEQLIDAMDKSMLSALEEAAQKGPFAEQQRERLRRRLTLAADFPFRPAAREQLNGLLLAYIDRLGDETYLRLEQLSETNKLDDFVETIDARIVGIYPQGSQFFLRRLDDPSLPRPSDATREAIVARARTMKEQGTSFTPASCLVVRRLLLLESSTQLSNCELPETF